MPPYSLSRKLGAISFSKFGNGVIDVKSGCSALVSCATIKWVHNLDSVSKGGSRHKVENCALQAV